MEEENWKVYKHTNKINNKVYIGITGQKVKQRWMKGKGYKYNSYFWNAIQKYGWNNFEHKVLFENLTKEEACNKEIKLISFYKSQDHRYGYNLAQGGCASRHSKETKLKISKANKGRTYSDNTLKLMKLSGKERVKYEIENNISSRIYLIDNFKKYIETTKREVIDLNTLKVFNSITEASQYFNCYTSTIINCCQDGRIHKNLRFAYYEDYINNNIIIKSDGRRNLRKSVICLNTFEIFTSTLDVKNKLNIDASSIAKVCNNKRKSAGKFSDGTPLRWQYLDEYMQQNGYTDISQIPNVIIHNEDQESQLAS